MATCEHCGAVLVSASTGRPKRFCSDAHRQAFAAAARRASRSVEPEVWPPPYWAEQGYTGRKSTPADGARFEYVDATTAGIGSVLSVHGNGVDGLDPMDMDMWAAMTRPGPVSSRPRRRRRLGDAEAWILESVGEDALNEFPPEA